MFFFSLIFASGHAHEQYNWPWIRPRAAPPYWCVAVGSVSRGRTARLAVIGPACGDDARVVGARRDCRAYQLADPRPLGRTLGTARANDRTIT